MMKLLSISLWLLFLLYIGAYLFGNMAIPLVLIIFVAAYLAESKSSTDHETSSDTETPPPSETPQPNTQEATTATQTHDRDGETSPDGIESDPKGGQSNKVFITLTSACLLVLLWKYPLLLLMLVPLSVLSLLKFVVSLAVKDSFICKLAEVTIDDIPWLRRRKAVLFPSPMPKLFQMYVSADKKFLNFVKNSTGSLLSAFIIISLVIVSISGVVLLIIAVLFELTHYKSVAVGVWNRTIADNLQVTE